jgi:hypothetical protein
VLYVVHGETLGWMSGSTYSHRRAFQRQRDGKRVHRPQRRRCGEGVACGRDHSFPGAYCGERVPHCANQATRMAALIAIAATRIPRQLPAADTNTLLPLPLSPQLLQRVTVWHPFRLVHLHCHCPLPPRHVNTRIRPSPFHDSLQPATRDTVDSVPTN